MLANHHAPASNDSPQGDSDRSNPDYDIILTALMESARGRSFLEEHARRSRATETATLLAAIGRIEDLLTSRSLQPAGQPLPQAAEPFDADVFEAEAHQNENSAPQGEDHEVVASAVTRDVEIMSRAVTPDQPSAIEFLGPQPLSSAAPDERQPPADPKAKTAPPQSRDPFADIRALSDEERIALFA